MSLSYPSTSKNRDLIFVRNLELAAQVGKDCWSRTKPQPLSISLFLRSSVALAGSTDHLPYSIHYGTVTKRVTKLVEGKKEGFESLQHLAEDISQLVLSPELGGSWIKVVAEQPKALLRADCAGVSLVRGAAQKEDGEEDVVYIRDLHLRCIIGINPWEMEFEQQVLVNLTLFQPLEKDFREIALHVEKYVEKSNFLTLEAFVTNVAREIVVNCGVEKVTVRAEKPRALTFAAAPGVEVTRNRSFFLGEGEKADWASQQGIYLAIGGNVGDRWKNINDAMTELSRRGVKVLRTSSLYESEPMYVTDQPKFLNGVCQVETKLPPNELLTVVKSIEDDLGRIKTIENGPRPIDLDILLYNDAIITTEKLTIPHASMLERRFVLEPLTEIAPSLRHPRTNLPFSSHLSILPEDHMSCYTPYLPAPTCIMAVLNLTPDSFSDGGVHTTSSIVATAKDLISSGAKILDLGGASTRPGSAQPSEEEELNRVIPAIKLLREAGITTPISIDTYRANVARAAVSAGADIINDVAGGLMDADMFSTVAELGVPIIIGHMRGTPATMDSLTKYENNDIITGVSHELEERVKEAEAAGVKRWNIMLDPGLGFAKTANHSIEILRRLKELKTLTAGGKLPWVLGPSRKGFVGKVTGEVVPSQRQFGTAGAVAACIAGGAEVVRVHDVKEMKSVVDMALAIWK
ncbi:Dihydropteroate synthase [Ascodesmis nigricans]|uniref:Folic acid synthesis protein FOL1 n=1 Tax=Ascodesmis nigricans TaxID=341454 RepID=A0A4S2N6Z4_9PEZI|nr:Dihydropteroate synthase [Ascodesmis nigricans]